MAAPLVAAWLARLTRTGKLTPAGAVQLATQLVGTVDLPLRISRGLYTRELDGGIVQAYLGRWKGEGAIRLSKSSPVRARYRDALQADFEKQTKQLARSVASGRLSVAAWQSAMQNAISNHTIRQAALGRGSTMTKAQVVKELVPKVQADLAYLQRFADEIALGKVTGKPLSAAQITARSALYAGTGRAEWFEQNEQQAARPGFVVRYKARDDNGTCFPCHRANGWYLPGQGPMPGKICQGRSRCRCRRDIVENRAVYDRLIAQGAVQQTA